MQDSLHYQDKFKVERNNIHSMKHKIGEPLDVYHPPFNEKESWWHSITAFVLLVAAVGILFAIVYWLQQYVGL